MPNADFSKLRDNAYCVLEGKAEPLTFPKGSLTLFFFILSNSNGPCFRFSGFKMFYELFQLLKSESD